MNATHRRLILTFCSAGLAATLQAESYWWAGDGVNLGGAGSWDTTSSNWRQGADSGPFVVWPNTGTENAVFSGTVGSVTLGAGINAASLTFTTGNGWTLVGGTLNVGTATSLVLTNSATVSIGCILSGAGTLTLESYGNNWPGRVEGISLLGSNGMFTGKLVVQKLAGNYFALSITNDINLGAVPASYVADALTVNGSFFQAGNSAVVNIPANRGISVGSGGMTFGYGAGFSVGSRITGVGGVALRNTTVTFGSASNDFSGSVSLNGGVVIAGVDNALPHGAGKGNLYFGDWNGVSTIDLNGHELAINGMDGNKCVPNSAFNNSATGAAVLVIGDNNASGPIAFCGIVTNSGGPLSLTKIGSGTQTFTGTNTHAGDTTVNGGKLVLTASAVSSNSTFIINNVNGFIFSNQSSAVLGGFGGTGQFVMVDSGGSALDLVIGCNNTTSCFSGVISGPGRLTKAGSGAWIMNGQANHSGGTVVSAGFLGGTGAVNGAVAVSDGCGLAPGNNGVGTLTVGNLALSGNTVYEWDYGLAGGDLVLVTNQFSFASGSTNTIRVFNPGRFSPPGDIAVFSWDVGVAAPDLAGVVWKVEQPAGGGAELWPQPEVVADVAKRRICLRILRGTVIVIK